jgi:hypothetical protein
MPPFAVFVSVSERDAAAIEFAAPQVVAPYDFTVRIDPDFEEPTLELHIDSESSEDARNRARALYARIREIARLPPDKPALHDRLELDEPLAIGGRQLGGDFGKGSSHRGGSFAWRAVGSARQLRASGPPPEPDWTGSQRSVCDDEIRAGPPNFALARRLSYAGPALRIP